jgi:hypothetical protein
MYCLFSVGRYYLDAVIYDKPQDLEEQDFEQKQGERGKRSLTQLIIYSLSLYNR